MSLNKVLKIYFDTLVESFMAVLRSWRHILVQVPALFIFGILTVAVGHLGILGGLIMGLLSTLMVSYYLVLIRSVVKGEKFSLEIIKEEGIMLFYPALSVFFAFFLIQIALSVVHSTFIKIAVGILISVLLNPIVEFLYLEESNLGDLVERSFEFISRNFLTWFLPIFICISPIILETPENLPLIFSQDPLTLIRSLLGSLSFIFSVPTAMLTFIPMLYVPFFVMVFRGKLLIKLQ